MSEDVDFTANAVGQVWRGTASGLATWQKRLPRCPFLKRVVDGADRLELRNGYGQTHLYERQSNGLITRNGAPVRHAPSLESPQP